MTGVRAAIGRLMVKTTATLLIIWSVWSLGGSGAMRIEPAPSGAIQRLVAAAVDAGWPMDALPAPRRSRNWDIANLDHARVEYWTTRFQADLREDFGRFLERKGRFEGLITAALDQRGMPRDLVYLAMIESGFNPRAYSPAKAAGMWQFVSATGKRYGLRIDKAIDERNDPVRATEAALEYLSDLHRRFGSWYLAAAAYNTGENRVGRIMRQVIGSERGTDADYYAIWPYLPRETRDYVPLMIAAARISKQPEAYGFEYVQPLEPWAFEEVVARPGTLLKKLARDFGVTLEDLRALNPQLRLDRTCHHTSMSLRVPAKADTRGTPTREAD
jgi:membrane-bound lytic murein transglycosylase D